MKKPLFILLAGIICFASCKEVDPPLVISHAVDTTYQGAIPAVQSHNVLIEDFTGQSCSNCPGAEQIISGILSQNAAGSVNVIGLYINNFSQTTPPAGAKYDFRTTAASLIGTGIYGAVQQMPVAGIDRVSQGGTLLQGQGTWSGSVSAREGIADSLNLTLQSTYNAASSTATIIANVTYVQPMFTKQKLSIAIIEDSITDFQEYPYPNYQPSGIDSNYLFNNVCRDIITALPAGDPVIDTIALKEPGRVLQSVYQYTIKPSLWVPQHCRLVGFVTDADGTVLQSFETNLTTP